MNNSKNVNAKKWQDYDDAFNWLNQSLFRDELTPCLIHITSKDNVGVYGIFKPRSIELSNGDLAHVIKFHPDIESLPAIKIMAFLANQMVHQWCYETSKNKTKTPNHCSEKFKEKAKEIGLQLHEDTDPNNKRRDYNVNFDYDPKGKFALLADFFLSENGDDFFKKAIPVVGDDDDSVEIPPKKGSKTLYVCPHCSARVWGKSGLNLICGDCSKRLEEIE